MTWRGRIAEDSCCILGLIDYVWNLIILIGELQLLDTLVAAVLSG